MKRRFSAVSRSYRIAAMISAVILIGLLSLVTVVLALRGGEHDPCSDSPDAYGGVMTEVGPAERRAFSFFRFDDSEIRIFPPARVCRVYGLRYAGEAGPLGDRDVGVLVGKKPDPSADTYPRILLLALLPLLFVALWRGAKRVLRPAPTSGSA